MADQQQQESEHDLFGEETNVLILRDNIDNSVDDTDGHLSAELYVTVFLGFLFVGFFLMLGIMYCSKHQEQRRIQNSEKHEEAVEIHEKAESMVLTLTDSATKNTDHPFRDEESSDTTACSDHHHKELQLHPGDYDNQEKGGTTDDDNNNNNVECTICSKPLLVESDTSSGNNNNNNNNHQLKIIHSNNPKCNHSFHAECVEHWLQYQNTCPNCNNPFILMTA